MSITSNEMISFPAIWIWYGFLLLGGLLLLLALTQLINGVRHGSRMPLNIFASGIFVLGIATIAVVTLSMLANVDWSVSYSLAVPSIPFLHF